MQNRSTVIALGIVWMSFSAAAGAAVAPHPDWVNSLKPAGEPAEELSLAVAGRTEYRVLLPAEPTSQDSKAAVDLAKTLSQITGAEFPIIHDGHAGADRGRVISIGRTARMQAANLPQAKADLDEEGYAIAVKDGSLYIFGGRLRGAIYGVYAFLEEDLRCRWYVAARAVTWGAFPKERGNLGEPLLPRDPDLRVRPVPRHFVPPLFLREPFYADAFDPTWKLQNRVNGHYGGVSDAWGGRVTYTPGYVHTFHDLLPPGKYFKDNPEYYMLDGNGNRSNRQLCQTHPEVIRLVTAAGLRVLGQDTRTGARILEVSPMDGGQHCLCPTCEKINKENGSPSGSLIYFVNKIAEGIEPKYPHVLVSTLAYLDTANAPTKIRPRDNVTVRLCNDLHSWRYPLTCFATKQHSLSKQYRKAIEDWSKICKNVTIWDYFINYSHLLAPMPNMHVLKPSVDFYVRHNVRGLMFQGAIESPGAARAPMRCWVMAKLFWDPSRDVDALMRDFVFGYYGRAAPQMWAYYELLDETRRTHLKEVATCGIRWDMNSPMYSRDFLARAGDLFRLAEAAAKPEPLLRRVQLEKLPILYIKLMQGPGATDEDYAAMIDQFEKIARREQVAAMCEVAYNSSDLNKHLAAWRSKIAKPKVTQPPAAKARP